MNTYRFCFVKAKTRKTKNSGQLGNVREILINGKNVTLCPKTTSL